eukprot:Seg470.8 transcript_id=Seg470.8/GoldUCD/mRNA.D3Y31 product="hypothetical protein" protein_id=Seg470.8/GoldUCD/D3Y31
MVETKHKIEKTTIQGMTYSSTGRANAAAAKKSTALEVKRLLRHRFAETSSELYEALRIYDPQHWSEESNYGVSELQHLVKRFEKPLSAAGLDDKALMPEWRKFNGIARRQMNQFFGEPKSLMPRSCIMHTWSRRILDSLLD